MSVCVLLLYFTDCWHTWALQVQLFFFQPPLPPHPPLPRLQKLQQRRKTGQKKTEEETDGRRRLLLFFLSHNRRFWHRYDYEEHREDIGGGFLRKCNRKKQMLSFSTLLKLWF